LRTARENIPRCLFFNPEFAPVFPLGPHPVGLPPLLAMEPTDGFELISESEESNSLKRYDVILSGYLEME
jgi:hypothetical protein